MPSEHVITLLESTAKEKIPSLLVEVTVSPTVASNQGDLPEVLYIPKYSSPSAPVISIHSNKSLSYSKDTPNPWNATSLLVITTSIVSPISTSVLLTSKAILASAANTGAANIEANMQTHKIIAIAFLFMFI